MNNLLLCKRFLGIAFLLLAMGVSTGSYATCTANASFTYKDSNGVYYFKNLSTGGNRYMWNFGDGNYSYNGSPTVSYTYGRYFSGTITVYLTVWDTTQSNCRDTMSATFYIRGCKSAPSFSFITLGYKATFTNTSNTGLIYKWTFGDGNKDTAYSPVHTYGGQGKYNAKLVVIDTGKAGCKDSITRSIDLTCKVSANISYKDSISLGVHYFYSNSSYANKFNWDFGDGSGSNLKNPTHTYSSSGFYNVYLIAEDSNMSGCKDTADYMNVPAGCVLNANWTYTKYGSTKVNFYAGTSYATNFKWTFTSSLGTTTSTQKNPVITFIPGYTYTVKLLAWDYRRVNCKDSNTKTVGIASCGTVAGFNYTTSGKTVSCSNTSTRAYSYAWKFGTTGSSTLKNPSYTFSTSGTYTVRLIAKDTNGTCADTITKTVTVSNCTAKAKFSGYPQGLKVSFYSNSTGSNKYLWKFGDGATSTDQYPVHTYSTGGTYTVKLYAMDSSISGCKDSISYSYTLNPCYINASFGSHDTLGTVHFWNWTVGGNKYKWTLGDGSTSSDSAPTHAYGGPSRNFYVTLIVWDTNYSGCSDTVSYWVHSLGCKAKFTIVPDTSNQYSALVIENSRAGSGTQYVWDFGDGDTSHSRTPAHTYAGTGPYLLCLTIYDSTCTSTYCDTVGFDSLGNMLAMKPFTIKMILPGEKIEDPNSSVEELDMAGLIRAYPNPAGNVVNIVSGAWVIMTINILDVQGKNISSATPAGMSQTMDINGLSPGLYFIVVQYDNNKYTRIKLIKN